MVVVASLFGSAGRSHTIASMVRLPVIDGSPPPAAPPEARREGALFDAHGRVIRDVRLSVTDRCNYRCTYCMAPGHRYMPKQELLSLDEYIRVAEACASLGVHKIRLTGGEPTLYRELDALINAIGRLPYTDIAMTTNGSLLNRAKLDTWRAAGLQRLTFSLDSLRPERVAAITRTRSHPDTVRDAVRLAQDAGYERIKINAVVMRGVNDDEVADFADLARELAIDVRLIEWMPLDSGRTWDRARVATADDMLAAIRARHDLVDMPRTDAHETSLNYRFADGAPGRIGVIASVTRQFCGACSRLRITADGKVRPCLFAHDEWDLRPTLRGGGDVEKFITDAMWGKQAGHGIDEATFAPPERGMSAIGG